MALLEVLACRESPWIMWMDIDAVFASTDISVADVLRGIGAEEGKGGLDMQTKDIIFSRNYNERVALLNTGVFLLRNSGYSARFLARVYNEVTLEVVHHPWWENKAMDDFAVANRQEFYDHCMIVSPHWFNQHRMQFRSGDFVAHYAGMTSRYQRIMADLSQGILGTSDWANGTKALRKAHCGPYPPEPKELHGSQTRIRPSQITVVQSRGGLPCKPCTRAVTLHSCMDGPCLMHQ